MGIEKPSNGIVFADEKIKKAWEETKLAEPELAKQLMKAKDDILQNAFCGIQLPKNLIPKEYIQKYGINNLWKYNLPNA